MMKLNIFLVVVVLVTIFAQAKGQDNNTNTEENSAAQKEAQTQEIMERVRNDIGILINRKIDERLEREMQSRRKNPTSLAEAQRNVMDALTDLANGGIRNIARAANVVLTGIRRGHLSVNDVLERNTNILLQDEPLQVVDVLKTLQDQVREGLENSSPLNLGSMPLGLETFVSPLNILTSFFQNNVGLNNNYRRGSTRYNSRPQPPPAPATPTRAFARPLASNQERKYSEGNGNNLGAFPDVFQSVMRNFLTMG